MVINNCRSDQFSQVSEAAVRHSSMLSKRMACCTALYLRVLRGFQSRQQQGKDYPKSTGKKSVCLLGQIKFLCTESKQLLIQYHTYKCTNFAFKPNKNSAAEIGIQSQEAKSWQSSYFSACRQILFLACTLVYNIQNANTKRVLAQEAKITFKFWIWMSAVDYNSSTLFNAVRQAPLWALWKNPFSKTALVTWNCMAYFNMVF